MNLPRFLAGIALSALIGYVGYRRASLSPSGVVGAVIVGSATFGLGGWKWGVLVVGFFVTSSALSRFRAGTKAGLAEKYQKGHRRDLGQTFANGGTGALLALAYALYPSPWLYLAFVGTLAAVNADTWATELGVLSRVRPRLITTGQPVEAGTSGAISLVGTGAALAGAAFIGLLALALSWLGKGSRGGLWLFPLATLGGLAGACADSLLGATVQSIYYCDVCQKETERRIHGCGQPTRRWRGWRWLDNDAVNFVSALVGGIVTAGLGNLLL